MSAQRVSVPATSWMRRGACRGKVDLFFPAAGSGTISDEARAVCREQCPVLRQCEAYAEEYNPVGLWAGLTDRERRRARRGGA